MTEIESETETGQDLLQRADVTPARALSWCVQIKRKREVHYADFIRAFPWRTCVELRGARGGGEVGCEDGNFVVGRLLAGFLRHRRSEEGHLEMRFGQRSLVMSRSRPRTHRMQ